jgi:polyferredoxin
MVQLLSLALWLGLFLITRGPINELIRPDLFLLTDPLVAAVSMGAARVFVPAMFASLGLVLLTLIFGRAFCGWICPLGTLIDGAAKLFDPPEKRFSEQTHEHLLRWKYWILAGVLVAAIFSCQLVFLLDPLVLTFRATAAGLYPVAANLLPRGTLDAAWAIRFSEIAFAPLALLIAILALTAITPRFYCRYLCPLGALYALISRVPLLRRRVSDDCDGCDKIGAVRQCVSGCRMGAVPINPRKTRNHECIRCMTGRSFCHAEAIRFDMRPPVREKQDRALDVGRRGFMVSAVAGLGLAPVLSRTGYHRDDPRAVIRPPRVLEENTFLDQCVRCGMCVQACPSQTLQLVWLESGLNGLWSPAVTPRIGGCVPDCNACSLVCPTEAIPPFGKKNGDKWVVKMGTAIFEAGLCISYTELQNCSKCIRICPTKALILDTSPGQHPERPVGVDFMKCMGCGLCEWECIKIVYGAPAIVTSSHGRGQPTVLR